MVDNAMIKQMLDKAAANPFYFGSDNESYFWRIAVIEDEIFAERAQCVCGCDDYGYYCCSVDDVQARENMYFDMVIDFATNYCAYWYDNIPSDVFEETAGPDDAELREILLVFHKKYSNFLNDVMYWFSFLIEYGTNEYGVYEIANTYVPCSDKQVVKSVLRHLSLSSPVVINSEDTEYIWQLARANGRIWYRRTTRFYRDDYIYNTDEYGYVSCDDADAIEALRDAIRLCFFIEGWEIVEDPKNDVDAMFALVDLSLGEFLV